MADAGLNTPAANRERIAAGTSGAEPAIYDEAPSGVTSRITPSPSPDRRRLAAESVGHEPTVAKCGSAPGARTHTG
jgi:hypothetical protein